MRFIFYLRWLWVSTLLTGFQPAAGAYEGRYPGQPGVSAVLVIPAGTGGGLRVTLPEGAYWPDGGVSHSAKNIAIPSQPEPLSFCYSGHWPGSGEQPPSQCYSLLLLPSPEPVTATATANSGLPLTLLNGVISRLVASAQDFIPGWLSAPVRLDVPDLNEGQQPGLPLATLTNGGQGGLFPDFGLSAPQPRFQLFSSRPPVFLELFPQPVMKMAAPDGDGDDDGNPDQLLYYDHDGALRAINLPPGLPVEDEVRLSSRERALWRRSSPELNDPDRHYRAIIKSVLKGRITLASHQGHKVYILRTADGRTLVLSGQQIEGILFSHSSLGSRHYEHDPYVEFLQTRYHWPWFRQGRVDRKPAVQIPTAAPGSRIKGDPAGPSSGTPEDPNGKGNEEKKEKITNRSAINSIDRRDNGTAGNSSSLAPVVARKVTRASVTRVGSATTVAVDFLMLNKKAEAFFVAIETAKEFLTFDAQQKATITLCLNDALKALSYGAVDSNQADSFRRSVQGGLACLNECLNKGIDNQEGTFFHHNAAGLAIAVTIALSLLSAGEDSQSASIKQTSTKQTLQWLAEAVTAADDSSPGSVTGELEEPVAWLGALQDQILHNNWLLPSSGATPETKVQRLLEAIDQVKRPSQGAQVSAHQHWLQEAFYEIQRGLRLRGLRLESGASPHPANASASTSVISQVYPGNITAFLQSLGKLTEYVGLYQEKVIEISASRPREAEKRVLMAQKIFVDTQAQEQVHREACFGSQGGGGDGGDTSDTMAEFHHGADQAHVSNITVSRVQEKKDPEILNIDEVRYFLLERGTDCFNDRPIKEGGRRLGSGAFSTVHYGELDTLDGGKRKVAVKRLKKATSLDPGQLEVSRQQFGTEIHMLTRYVHKNIIRLLGYSRDGPQLCLIYEYMTWGTLAHRLDCKDGTRALYWERRLIIAVGLAAAIDFLHNTYRQAVIHRDIKSSNVLLDGHLQPRLGDFGLAVLAEDDQDSLSADPANKRCFGTRPYMPPEAFNKPYKIDVQTDVYAFGVLLYELATGLPPYSSSKKQNLPEYVDHMRAQRIDLAKMLDPKARYPKGMGDRQGLTLMDIADAATTKDKKVRPHISELQERLNKLATEAEGR